MRTVRESEHTKVECLDEPGAGGACHHYEVINSKPPSEKDLKLLGLLGFQKGPIQEAGVNGLQNEDLLAIVIDRLTGFQSGEFACNQNALALSACLTAIRTLDERTADRKARNVEGKSEA